MSHRARTHWVLGLGLLLATTTLATRLRPSRSSAPEATMIGVTVVAQPAWSPQRAQNSGPWPAVFRVTNTTGAAVTYTFTCSTNVAPPPLTCQGNPPQSDHRGRRVR